MNGESDNEEQSHAEANTTESDNVEQSHAEANTIESDNVEQSHAEAVSMNTTESDNVQQSHAVSSSWDTEDDTPLTLVARKKKGRLGVSSVSEKMEWLWSQFGSWPVSRPIYSSWSMRA